MKWTPESKPRHSLLVGGRRLGEKSRATPLNDRQCPELTGSHELDHGAGRKTAEVDTAGH